LPCFATKNPNMGSGGDWSFMQGKKGNLKLFSRYEMLERIGEGTFGKMYKGWHKVGGLTMALKEMWNLQCSNHDVEALMALTHPNVVQLIQNFMKGPNLVLMLEYLSKNLMQMVHNQVRSHCGKRRSKVGCYKFWPRLRLVIGRQFFTRTWNLQIY
jgi:serine/threonine protein kinase